MTDNDRTTDYADNSDMDVSSDKLDSLSRLGREMQEDASKREEDDRRKRQNIQASLQSLSATKRANARLEGQLHTRNVSRVLASVAVGSFCLTLWLAKSAMRNETTATNTNSQVLATNTDLTRLGQDAATCAWGIDKDRIFVTDIDDYTQKVCLNLHGTAAASMVSQVPGEHEIRLDQLPALMEAMKRSSATAEGSCTAQTGLLADDTKADGDEDPIRDA